MRWIKRILGALLGLIAFIALLLLVGAAVYRDVPASEVEAKWARPPSKFVVIDGVRLHYRDEGRGPAVVLLHANYSSLFMWEPWVAKLRDDYRVIRVDLPAHGLTGPEPNGNYTLERIQTLFERFVDERGLGRFTVVGTSIGGTVAMRYTAAHPERIERLVLISPGSLEARVRGRTTPANVPRVADLLGYVTPKAFTRFLLTNDYGDPARLSDAVTDEWYDMWMREGNRLAMINLLRQYVSGGVEDKIRAVKVPVLLIWGEKNKRVPLALAYETQKLLENSPEVKLEILPGIGHMLVQEAPQQSAQLIRRYLDERTSLKTEGDASR
ncbi:MAG: alpha/beta hydrolase [Gammaproteobacteria bacterium]|jgi:pimeloyl-ACP methyl ester carboxylesterase|nr:alpha/beta hydrolase [Gammaproteobacteria bacterium]NBR16990.1 alpha/beta hydrolase [Gammaproteobacteria bacterium]NCW21270.1 alpha/beta hydrolase [Gammaproteobacteria bacterium]NCW57606.1 alpha/beta hydrolase [Gammaproteobacteria bacterium]NDA43397.1 alpha/beta hydrolase [Gammaproteobacteria bacterium]